MDPARRNLPPGVPDVYKPTPRISLELAAKCEAVTASALEARIEKLETERDRLAAGIRSFLASLPYAAPEMIGWLAEEKLASMLGDDSS